ncbi:hypothetical protein BDW75DRAFT_246254 [Aspergillus navahoensis]
MELRSSSGGGNLGECTSTSGILSNYEIPRIMDLYKADVQYDETAGVKSITWDIRYNDGETLRQKRDFANLLCLAGTFAWAVDLGGPGNKSDLASMDSNSCMDGADPGGLDSGSGDMFIGQKIHEENWHTIICIPPLQLHLSPTSLSSTTTTTFEPYTTLLEVAWPTTTILTQGNTLSTSTGLSAQSIQQPSPSRP